MDCHPPMGEIKVVAPEDFPAIYEIINDAAEVYKGIIPADRWHEPYMTREALAREMDEGVAFSGYYADGRLVGVMGVQDRGEVVLIRHAYVRTSMRNGGIGGRLLEHLLARRDKPVLIGTWAAAAWAIRFYERHGFRVVGDTERKNRLLRRFWNIPERQVETSVVLEEDAVRDDVRQDGQPVGPERVP